MKNKFIYWTPRILSIMFICFLALFSLDVFESTSSAGEIALGLLIHNIPALILTGILIVSWKHEIVGGIVFILAGLFYLSMMFKESLNEPFAWYMISNSLIISGPAFLIGGLSLVGWIRKRKSISLS